MRIFVMTAALLCTAALPAAARPRDEAMSGAFRCAAIGELRVWLDCFYGAAQPVRAVLGMPPAPQAQTRLVAAPPTGTVQAPDAALRDRAIAIAFQCNGAGDDRQWLNCYYAAVADVRTRLGLATPVSAVPQPSSPMPDFGLPAKPRNQISANVNRVTARLAVYSFDGDGMFTVTLDNGQVWHQVNGDSDYAHWKKPAANYTVRITRGLLGSYNLQVPGTPGVFKVRRVT